MADEFTRAGVSAAADPDESVGLGSPGAVFDCTEGRPNDFATGGRSLKGPA